MKILPDVLRPPARPTPRKHTPEPAGASGYQQYRACLRWEFGFTCPFCLLHEGDLMPSGSGVERTGLTSIEHRVPRSAAPELKDVYDNCFYACRYCNGARSFKPEMNEVGCRLLDPTRDGWSDHFSAVQDQLVPRAGDRDALYTCGVYDLNDARKVEMRGNRRRWWEDRMSLVNQGPAMLDALLQEAGRSEPARAKVLLEVADALRGAIRDAHAELKRFAAVPVDAPRRCRCARTDHHVLPDGLAVQMVEVDVPRAS